MTLIKHPLTLEIVARFAQKICRESVRVWTLQGSLGAGKTTLVQAMMRCWGIQEPVVSPTYAYMTVYRMPEGPLYHFDLYRLTSCDDFITAGFDEYLADPQARVIIEWPECIKPLLTSLTVCEIYLEYIDATTRQIYWTIRAP